MKKTKLIAITLIISVMLMGAGYAYWTDSLIIDNTVSTGTFDMTLESISNPQDYDNYLENSGEGDNPFGTGTDYVNPQISDGVLLIADFMNDKITFINTNLYPGSGAYLSFKISNEGSVPARVQDVIGTVKIGNGLEDEFIYTIGDIILYENREVNYNGSNIDATIARTLYYNRTQYGTFNEFIAALNTKLGTYNGEPIILQPGDFLLVNGAGDKVELGYDVFFDPDATEVVDGTAITTEGKTFSFDLDFTYTQWNN